MSASNFDVRTTSHFDRLFKKLVAGHRKEDVEVLGQALAILEADPFNRTRRYPIKKLEDVAPGEGQYRLRIRRWRFRYDIWTDRGQVELSYCGLRRENTY
jgi:hypothetical protein